MHDLSGLTLDDVELTLYANEKPSRPLDRRRGSFLFTHGGISGPVALNISGSLTKYDDLAQLRLLANFLPNESSDSLRIRLLEIARSDGKRRVLAELTTRLPKSLARGLAAIAQIPDELPLAELSNSKLENLCQTTCRSVIHVTGTRGFDKAEVTAGGVSLKEVDSRTMESKIVPRLFLAGEILDLDGAIGGFNFQAAFSTGWIAGENA
jgi:predicted Rossmann fold flavoprotein